MSPLETAVVRAAASIVPSMGRKLKREFDVRRAVEQASSMAMADTSEAFVESLTDIQLQQLEAFINSQQFAHLTRQTLYCSMSGYKVDADSAIREQVRSSVRLSGSFDGADLTQLTDVLHGLMKSAVVAIKATVSQSDIDNATNAAMAGSVAAAAVRNSELMQRVESLNEINSFARKMRSQAVALNGRLKLPNVVQARTVTYSQLYVSPILVSGHGADSQYATVEDAVVGNLRLVVVGDPGAGKSTLASKLVYDIASGRIRGLEDLVPLLLIVRKHTQHLRTEHETLIHYLDATCRNPYNVPPPDDAIEYLLLNGRAVVVIDGLDELGDSRYRNDFARMVDGFCHLYPLARVIVTSRIVGYDEAPLDAEIFPVMRVAPFNDDQVSRYAKLWFGLDKSKTPMERKDTANSFIESSIEVRDLRENPLMLSLLCVLFTAEHAIPSRRPEIYERCAEILFDNWDRSRGISTPIRYRQQLRPVLQKLAWRIFTDPQGKLALPRSEVESSLTHWLRPRFATEPEAAEVAQDFLDFCAGRAWVLTDVGSDALEPQYGFVHKTFLEYFAATQIVKENSDPAVVWNTLRPNLQNSAWEMVIQIAVQVLERNRTDGADKLLRLMLDTIGEQGCSVSAGHRSATLRIAARLLNNVSPSFDIVKEIVEKAVRSSAEIKIIDRCTRVRWASGFDEGVLMDDDPLWEELVGVTSPEVAHQIAGVIAEALEREARELPADSSAGLLYSEFCEEDSLIIDLTSMAGAVREALSQRDMPASAELWMRMKSMPTVADLETWGAEWLYRPFTVGRSTWYPVALRASYECLGPKEASEGRVSWLESVYAFLASCSPSAESFPSGMLFTPKEGYGKDGVLERLPATARASLLLMLMPIFPFVAERLSAGRLRDLAGRHDAPERRAASIEYVNSLSLPVEAHERLVGWIYEHSVRELNGAVPASGKHR